MGTFFIRSLSLNIKNLPFIQGKAIPAEKLIIMTMLRKTFGLFENDYKNS